MYRIVHQSLLNSARRSSSSSLLPIRRILPSIVPPSFCLSPTTSSWNDATTPPHSAYILIARRGYRPHKQRRSKKQKQKKKPHLQDTPNPTPTIEVLPRPQDEAPYQEKFALPDRDKEKVLSNLQVHVQDLYKQGDYRKALPAAQDLLRESIDHFGLDHPATASAHNNVGLCHKQLGEFEDCRRCYNAALAVYKKSVGRTHSSYANCLHNLGTLNRNQIHFDTSLSSTDRLSLVESALEYLEESYTIRVQELGRTHPLAVGSRSAWGATLTTQILHQHKLTQQYHNSGDLQQKKFYISMMPTNITESLWEAAADHLKSALETSIAQPRGPSIVEEQQPGNSRAVTRGKKNKPMSKKKPPDYPTTLSAAVAAQNLAVFLKSRATTCDPYHADYLQQAETLYKQAIVVYDALLPENHPDVYMVKHSLAELWTVMGEEDKANALRTSLLDTFDPPPPPSTTTTNDEVQVSQTTTTTTTEPATEAATESPNESSAQDGKDESLKSV